MKTTITQSMLALRRGEAHRHSEPHAGTDEPHAGTDEPHAGTDEPHCWSTATYFPNVCPRLPYHLNPPFCKLAYCSTRLPKLLKVPCDLSPLILVCQGLKRGRDAVEGDESDEE